MSLKTFRSYQLAVAFHRSCSAMTLPAYLRDQLLRASSSVALNLAEGSAKPSRKDQLRFYAIAFASLRECQAALDLAPKPSPTLKAQADALGACLYRLCHPRL
ncbi:MAG: four helix bundle protein [Deltaproteobacteria bacterium]|nr:four helix bundle protein [Deltaproteobacteria bacterium]